MIDSNLEKDKLNFQKSLTLMNILTFHLIDIEFEIGNVD